MALSTTSASNILRRSWNSKRIAAGQAYEANLERNLGTAWTAASSGQIEKAIGNPV